jgi:hypothetical protein
VLKRRGWWTNFFIFFLGKPSRGAGLRLLRQIIPIFDALQQRPALLAIILYEQARLGAFGSRRRYAGATQVMTMAQFLRGAFTHVHHLKWVILANYLLLRKDVQATVCFLQFYCR